MQSRFAFPGKNALRIKEQKHLLAYFNFVDLSTGLEYRDFRLLNGQNGAFVAGPFRTYEDKDGETRYSDFVRPAFDAESSERNEVGVAFFAELTEAALEEFERVKAEGGSGTQSRTSGSKSGAKKSGRGPVRQPAGHDDDDEDLPFAA